MKLYMAILLSIWTILPLHAMEEQEQYPSSSSSSSMTITGATKLPPYVKRKDYSLFPDGCRECLIETAVCCAICPCATYFCIEQTCCPSDKQINDKSRE